VNPPSSGPQAAGNENLALLYQGVLTAIVRVQSGRQPVTDPAAFRKRIRDVLVEIEREALRLGYSAQDLSDTTYAVITFLDEAILNSDDPARDHWSSLQAELYERAVGGDAFFEQITRISARPDSPQLADILEVYYLCLLLGYQGRYLTGAPGGELKQIMNELRERTERIRGANMPLSPSAVPVKAAVPIVPSRADAVPAAVMWAPLAALIITVSSWLVYRFLLGFQADDVRRAVLTTLVP
jgi:type VI secretion system protein ImpK